MPASAESIGLALVVLSLVFACAALIRRWSRPLREWKGMTQVTAAAVFLGVTIALAIVLLQSFRTLLHLVGSDFFDKLPLFPFTFPAAVIVQLCARRCGFMTALSVPLIDLWGLPTFTIAASAVTATWVLWGIRRSGQWSGAPSTI
jgi:hypothetical protein